MFENKNTVLSNCVFSQLVEFLSWIQYLGRNELLILLKKIYLKHSYTVNYSKQFSFPPHNRSTNNQPEEIQILKRSSFTQHHIIFNFLARLVAPFHNYFAPSPPQEKRFEVERKVCTSVYKRIVIVEPLLDIYIPPTGFVIYSSSCLAKNFSISSAFSNGRRHIVFNARVTIRKRIASSPSPFPTLSGFNAHPMPPEGYSYTGKLKR